MADAYDYWRRELDQPGSQRRDTEEAILGWWRVRGAKTKHDNPCVVWKDMDGTTWLQRGRGTPWVKDSNEWFGWTQWQFVKADAVTQEDYASAMETGVWPDGKPAFPPKRDEETGEVQRRGDLIHDPENDGPVRDMLTDEIDSLAEAIEAMGGVTDQKRADRLGELYRRMRVLWQKADDARTKEKEPSLEEGRRIDNDWRPALAKAKEWGEHAKANIAVFLKKEEQRLREERAKELERQRAEDAQRFSEAQDEMWRRPEREEPPPTAKASGGSAGRAVSLRTVRRGVIENETKFINAIKKRDDFQKFIKAIADDLAKAKQPVNGMRIEEERI